MKSAFIRVARSGKTIDGRQITPDQIEAMAASYNPATYGARVNLEHVRSLLPDGPFQALGDVVALRAEPDGDQKVLLAQIDATPALLKLAQDRQKVYWSIEMAENFAGTKKPYLMGLAVTDSPASLGTEMLKFSLTQQADKVPADKRAHLYSEALEGSGLPPDRHPPDPGPGLLAKMRDMLTGQSRKDDVRLSTLETAMLELTAEVVAVRSSLAALPSAPASPPTNSAPDLAQLTADVTALREAMSRIPATSSGRPTVTGAPLVTDC
ncbi:GPO family capsid scaffolding protein [Pararhodospirillum photometricum]|uniref:Phage-related capsid scaffolding protein (GPO-like) n=1 Tax=Pararhodospirillum photometricum DSM 122 TaxID=1150469 RepID=H6SQH8_PARPM|nr:GPO family capsid scaffolding protein [Pararhodospirillum photometricum]CCG09697.1 Phage-related capsid scaffolding protein (GPO-like) [Pararhodospirillum photometricum DSM 122]